MVRLVWDGRSAGESETLAVVYTDAQTVWLEVQPSARVEIPRSLSGDNCRSTMESTL